jgi:transcriptional regulator with XRE-family HTH domain
VAADIGISHGTLSRIERGEAVDGVTLIKILFWLLS